MVSVAKFFRREKFFSQCPVFQSHSRSPVTASSFLDPPSFSRRRFPYQALDFCSNVCCFLELLRDRGAFFIDPFANCAMPTKKISANKSSRRRLNTGSALNSRQEATQLSLRGDAESAQASSSLIEQPIMDTCDSIVPSQPILVEPRINKRRDRSPSETSDGRAENSRGNTSSDRGNTSSD